MGTSLTTTQKENMIDTVHTNIHNTTLAIYTLILGLSLDNKSVEEVSVRECLCVISQFSPGMGCHENIAGSC